MQVRVLLPAPKKRGHKASLFCSSVSVPEIRLVLQSNACSLEDRIPAFLPLADIVVQGSNGRLAQHYDHGQVDDGHNAHQNVCQIPNQTEVQQCAHKDDDAGGNVEYFHKSDTQSAVCDVVQAALTVEQVAQQSGESKQQQGEGNEVKAEIAEGGCQSGLNEGRAGQRGAGGDAAAQAHHGRCGADQQSVDEHAEHLHKTLLDGMGHIRRRGGIGCGTDTGLVGVQAPLDALHQGAAGKTAEDGLKIKGTGKDFPENHRQGADIQNHGDQGHNNIGNAHDRHQEAGDLNDPLAAAQNTDGDQHSQNSTADQRNLGGFRIAVEAVLGQAGDQIVGAQHIEAHSIGGHQSHGENNAQPAPAKGSLDVVGRAAVAAALVVTFLVDLGQSAFDEGGSAAHQGDDPHPEDTAVAADGNGVGNAHDIAGAHAAGGGDHQRLESGDGILSLALFGDQTDGFTQQAELNEPGTESKIQSHSQQKDDQQIAVHDIAGGFDCF